MTAFNFNDAFRKLAGMTKPEEQPFPWQKALFERFVANDIPASCNLPTGLGKTSVVHLWLLALTQNRKLPRRLVYVVNRRTVVDQTTTEVENLRERLPEVAEVWNALWDMCASRPEEPNPEKDRPLAISTLRGQFADNREWSADPSRPAVICGTVDMIGSRLLFSGYGCGFKTRPLHAGFLGQDALVVHDEAHLEPAFQKLIEAIRDEQKREPAPLGEWTRLKVMELTATSRAGQSEQPFELTPKDYENKKVTERIKATKKLALHELEKSLPDDLVKYAKALTEGERPKDKAILIFAREVKVVEEVVKKLPKGQTQLLTGTLRGLERDRMADPRKEDGCPIFARFLKPPPEDAPDSEKWKVKPAEGTVYLVCTSAGEVGVNISADHLVCDLSTFESMAQRFGRVNRFGERDDTEIHVVYPKEFKKDDSLSGPLAVTLGLLELLNGDASPSGLTALREKAIKEGSGTEPPSTDRVKALRDYVLAHQGEDPRLGGYAPQPVILPTTDILFDAWALTTIRDRLPGRPHVEPYLHGVATWQPPETHVAWRQEVWELRFQFRSEEERKQRETAERKRLATFAEKLLEGYPLKPHELLRDNSQRVFDRLKKLKADKSLSVWLVDDDDEVEVTTLGDIIGAGKEAIERKTVLLPPSAGGLSGGFLDPDSPTANDVSGGDYYRNERGEQRRTRLWDKAEPPDGMRRVLTIDTKPNADEADEEPTGERFWHWYELRYGGDDEGIENSKKPVLWTTHTDDVICHTTAIVEKLRPVLGELADLLILAAKCHDLGKKRKLFQTVLGNRDYPSKALAKSGKKGGRVQERYRHEFGSLLDAEAHDDFKSLQDEEKAFVLQLIAAHHGRGRPHFPADEAFDPESKGDAANGVASEVPQRFARLQRKYGRWGLAFLESLLRAADYAASASPSKFEPEDGQ